MIKNALTFGLKEKTILTLGGVLLISMFTLGVNIYSEALSLAKVETAKLATSHMETLGNAIEKALDNDRQNLLSLRDTPPIEGIIRSMQAGGIDPVSGDSLQLWRERLEKIFGSFILNHPQYFQIRYINAKGNELVRVELKNNHPYATPKEQLQYKSFETYVTDTLQLPLGHFYHSSINLNREHGKIQVPHRPIFRIATPVYSKGRIQGLVIINLVSDYFFKMLLSQGDGSSHYITDEKGNFLVYSDMSKAFGFDLGFDFTLVDVSPELATLSREQDTFAAFNDRDHGVDGFRKIFYDPGNKYHYWLLSYKIPESFIFKNIGHMRNTIFVNGSIIALITLIIFAWFISSKVVTPVVNLAKTAKNMKDGDLSIRLDESLVKDEFRAVYATINDFAEVQQRHTIDLKQEVLKQTNHLSYIIDHLIYGLIIITEKGIITSFNPAAEKIFGYLAQEAIGKNVKMLMPEPYKHKHDGFLQGYRDRDQSDITGKIRVLDGRHKGGTIFPLELTINVMISDGTRQIIGTVRDITQRVVAQQALEDKSQDLELHSHYDKSYGKIMTLFSSTHEQEMALSDLLSILADGHAFPISAIYLFNEWSGTLKLTASHGAQKTLEKEFGRGDGLIGQALIDNKAVILKDFDKNGLRIDAGVISFVPSSVVVIPISYQAKVMGVLVLAANTMLGYMELPFLERITTQIGVFIHNLRQYHDLIELTEQSRQNAEEIRQQNMELEQANKMKSEFLANMSHELRSPLNAIIGFSALLKDGVLGELEADQAEYIGDIFNSGQHLLSLINDILDLSKIEAGKMELHLEATDIPKMLNNSLSIIKEQVLERHIKLEMNIDQGVESCWLDARKSKQIIFNLLSNAVKFTPEGGAIHIHAQKIKKKDLQGITNERFIPSTQVLASTKHFLEISISDTGIGISAENQQKLFQPFVQTDATLSRKFEGTGLGLVMIKGMVELHGGKVGLQSDEGEGSTFTVWLPYRTKQATSTISATSDNPTEAKEKADGLPATPTQQEAGKGEKRTVPSPAKGVTTVLAIEDNIVESNLLKHCLESVEYAVTQVINSVDALDAMRRDKPDLITLNMKMADMDSFEFLHQKNSIPEYMNIPMLLFSTDHGSHCQSLGINAIVQKPITMQLFLSLVDSLDTQKVNDGRPSVMVVDDDPKAVKIISAYFKATNFHVTKLYNGAQALTAIRQNIPNLFVIDLMMPDMDGFELIHHLKKNKKTHNTPIIVLTAKILTEGEQKQLLQQMCDIEDAALTKNLQP